MQPCCLTAKSLRSSTAPRAFAPRRATVAAARPSSAAAAALRKASWVTMASALPIPGRPNSEPILENSSFYDFEVKDIDGKPTKLEEFKGKVVLVVNLASKCKFTAQYSDLEELYRKYKEKGLVVAGFPCNQFGGQEPGPESEVKEFATSKFDVTFPLFSKIDVNGPTADPLYGYLKKDKQGQMAEEIKEKQTVEPATFTLGVVDNEIKWNFEKFLVDRAGQVVARYPPSAPPKELEAELAKLL